MDDETYGQRLRRLRRERGLSQRELAALVPCSQGMISQAETKWRGSFELARALDLALRAQGSLLELFPGVTVTVPAPYPEPVVMMATIEVGEVTVSVPLDRRTLLGLFGSAGLVATAAPPTVAMPPPEVAISVWRSELDRFYDVGEAVPPDEVTAQMVPYVAAIDTMSRTVPDRLQRDLLTVGSRYCEYLGWMRHEAGDLTGAWYWSDRASEWATVAGWDAMPPYVLARKAAFAWYAGDWSRSATLAQAADRTARCPQVRARAILQKARALALAAHRDDCDRALDRARYWIDQGTGAAVDEPVLTDSAEFLRKHAAHVTAYCWINTGRSSAAVDLYERELANQAGGGRRSASLKAWLAIAYARSGAPDRAVAAADEALSRMERVRSASVGHGLRQLAGALGRWNDRGEVYDIIHRARQLTA